MKKNFYDGYMDDMLLTFQSPYLNGKFQSEKSHCLATSSATIIQELIEKVQGKDKDRNKNVLKDDIIIGEDEFTDEYEKYPLPEWHWNTTSMPMLKPIITDMSNVYNERLVISVCKDSNIKNGNI